MSDVTNKGRQFAVFLGLAAFTYVPLLVHHLVGQIPFVPYDEIARFIPKVEWDYQRMERLYGQSAAEYFRIYFISNIVLYFLWLLVLTAILLVLSKRGISSRHLLISPSSAIYGTKAEHRFFFLLWLAIFLPIMVLPTWIAPPGYGSYYNMRPGLRSELLISAAFDLLTVYSAVLIVATMEKRAGRP